jgi:hypothetical protein
MLDRKFAEPSSFAVFDTDIVVAQPRQKRHLLDLNDHHLHPCRKNQRAVARRLSTNPSIGLGKRKSEYDILTTITANKRPK